MTPQRPRFPRSRFTLGAMVAAGILVIACEMPSPEMLAPDGKDVRTTRLLGKLQSVEKDVDPEDLKNLVAEKFAAVARGEGGPSILFVVKSSNGDIVMTERQSAENARIPVSSTVPAGQLREKQRVERTAVVLTEVQREPVNAMVRSPRETVAFKVRSDRGGLVLPTGVGSLRSDDIATVDVSKHGAGVLAPNPVSIVTIVLKPGAKVSQ